MNYLCISWWNDHDLGDILYQTGFKNKIYLDVEVEKPEYNTTIESDLNGDNVEIAKFRKWEKVYKFEAWMQEDLVDAFSLMQIHDNIEVTLQSGDVIQVARHGLKVDPSWEEIGCLAKCVVSFTENYVVAGNCDENKNLNCYCDPVTGTFEYIDQVGGGTPSPEGIIALLYSVDVIGGYKYRAELYVASGTYTWLLMPSPDQYSCYTNEDDSTSWFYDGQYWHKSPGYFYSASLIAGFHYLMTGWILPGAFGTISYNAGIGWIDCGDFTADEIAAGVDIDLVGSGTIDVKIEVWNHSCDYGETDSYEVIVP